MTSSFLDSFEGLWRRPAQDYKKGVQTYLVSLDTNVLLQLYRFTPDARNELLEVLGRLGERLWIPHHVAAEYYDRRVDAVKEHLALYTSVPKTLEESRKKAIQELHTFAKRCSMSNEEKKELIDPIEAAFAASIDKITRRGESFDLSLEKVVNEDPVLESLAQLLDGKTGTSFGDEESESLIAESKRRYEKRVPPGFRDASKPENAHGDFFVWEQLLREAKSRELPILFVTNDVKDDWVRKEANLVIGAHPSLLAEFKERCGTDFLVTQLGRFLQIAKEVLGASVSASTVAQAENTRDNGHAEVEVFSLTAEEFDSLALDLMLESRNWSDLLQNEFIDEDAAERARQNRARAMALHATFTGANISRSLDGMVHIPLHARDWSEIRRVRRRVRLQEGRSPAAAEKKNQSHFSRSWELLSEFERRHRTLRSEHERVVVSIRELEDELLSSASNSEGSGMLEAEAALASVRETKDDLEEDIRVIETQIMQTRRQMIEDRTR
ncbi:PIN domain-containing protein [Streptomyces mirabilis]|uniref:PIN domain-containing protein n=1 Tax=Streptomyces mirabilis TaxID=68239 RepID=UPI003711DABB